eukprot:2339923-Rhodomonas_salina.1
MKFILASSATALLLSSDLCFAEMSQSDHTETDPDNWWDPELEEAARRAHEKVAALQESERDSFDDESFYSDDSRLRETENARTRPHEMKRGREKFPQRFSASKEPPAAEVIPRPPQQQNQLQLDEIHPQGSGDSTARTRDSLLTSILNSPKAAGSQALSSGHFVRVPTLSAVNAITHSPVVLHALAPSTFLASSFRCWSHRTNAVAANPRAGSGSTCRHRAQGDLHCAEELAQQP